MTRRQVLLLVSTVLLIAFGVAAAPNAEKKGVFAPIEVGHQVGLKETASGYTIQVMPGITLGQKVIEVSHDYIVLEDPVAVTQTRIPVTAVKAVFVTKLPKDK